MGREKKTKPEWIPDDGGGRYASSVLGGVAGGHNGLSSSSGNDPTAARRQKKSLSVSDHVEGVLAEDRTILARTITLIESNAEKHLKTAQEVLNQVLPHTGKAIRVGITGVPGAGKSTFIDTLGTLLCQGGHKVAVLAVDPTSSRSGGSILGDKTRMENLSQQPDCFIRPSPSGGTLGGVGRKTRETMLVCEAAGFDVVLVETVGVGQSESLVSTMVDFFLLLTLTGAGDELQNIKKGVIEMADAVLINKADGDNRVVAERVAAEFNQALHYLNPPREGWETRAYFCSAVTGDGISEIWTVIQDFQTKMKETGRFWKNRQQQAVNWMHEVITDQIRSRFFNDPGIADLLAEMESRVSEGEITVTTAVEQLLRRFYGERDLGDPV